MYRDPVKVAKSIARVSNVESSLRLAIVLGYFSGHLTKVVFDSMEYAGEDFCVRIDNDMTLGVLFLAMTGSYYLNVRRRGLDVSALRYEDLMERPLEMIRVILEFCHLPASLAENGVKAFDNDSQRNSVISRSLVKHQKEPELTPQKKMKLNELLKKYGMPLIGEPCIIEGTLSCD